MASIDPDPVYGGDGGTGAEDGVDDKDKPERSGRTAPKKKPGAARVVASERVVVRTGRAAGGRVAARPARLSGVASGIVWPAIPAGHDAQVLALQHIFNETQWWNPERLLAEQLKQAQHLIRHAARTVPLYRERLAALRDVAPGALTMEQFRAIPLLTRADIQDAGADFASREVPPGHGAVGESRTSGSSGKPITFQYTAVTALMLSAMTLRGHLWHNRDLAAKNMKIRVTSKTGARTRWAPVPWSGTTVHISGRLPVNELLDHIVAEDPAYFEAHPNQVLGLLQRSAETGAKPKSLREVRTFGENLEPWLRDKCRDVWDVPMVDNYSAEEFGTIAHQCPVTTNLHVMAENVLVEVLDDNNQPCRPGETGRVVVTSLNNFATPLIRAELGDMARAGGPCSCGRGLPVLERILGRERHLFIRPDGERVFPEFYLEMTALAPVRQFQLTQKTLKLIEVKLAAARPLTAAEEDTARGFIGDGLGYAFALDFVYVDEIPREANGKYQDYRSEVSAATT